MCESCLEYLTPCKRDLLSYLEGGGAMKKGILLLVMTLFSYDLFWRVIPSGAAMGDRLGSTGGQVAAGDILTEYEGSWGFWFSADICQICIEDPRINWVLDSVDVNSVHISTFYPIFSCGGCPLALGTRFISSDTLDWTPGLTSARDEFVLKMVFLEDTTETPAFVTYYDAVRETRRWTDDGWHGGSVLDSLLYVAIELTTPNAGSSYGENLITTEISARFPLP